MRKLDDPGKMIKGMGGGDGPGGRESMKNHRVMEHMRRRRRSRSSSPECTLPLTGKNVVDMIITDLCVFHRPDHQSPFRLIELAPGVTAEEVEAKTTARYES
jgi:3-oxoacid CoA-transferase subunit B